MACSGSVVEIMLWPMVESMFSTMLMPQQFWVQEVGIVHGGGAPQEGPVAVVPPKGSYRRSYACCISFSTLRSFLRTDPPGR